MQRVLGTCRIETLLSETSRGVEFKPMATLATAAWPASAMASRNMN